MAGTTKRLDLQFGSFACSVQGFEDPVQPIQQVLQALQNLLEETPDLGGSGIAFDADTVEQLIGEVARRADLNESEIEIVPGLIIVHRGGEQAVEAGAAESDTDLNESGSWSRQLADAAPEAGRPETAAAEPGYVNIFAQPSDAGSDKDGAGAADDQLLTRLGGPRNTGSGAEGRGGAQNEPVHDIFAESPEAPISTGGNIFADPFGVESTEPDEDEDGDGDGDDGPVMNLFADANGEDDIGAEEDPEVALRLSDRIGGMFSEGEDDHEAADTNGGARIEALFGDTENQPADDGGEGYTAAGLAKSAQAETVADLMVSAAAWMVLLQGQTTFTRNDVVEVFNTIPGEHVKSAEARIKGFGKAVRNGQLVMVEDGVFGLARTELERFQRLL